MKKKEPVKAHKHLFEAIAEIRKPTNIRFSKTKSLLDGIEGTIEPLGKDFVVHFEEKVRRTKPQKWLEVGQYHKKVSFTASEKMYVAKGVYLRRNAHPKYEADIDCFYTKKFSKKTGYYFRLVIPLKKKLDFMRSIEQGWMDNDLGGAVAAITAQVHGDEVNLCCADYGKGLWYLVIETKKKQDFESFGEKAYAVQLALGYILGYFAGDQGYYFAYTNKKMLNFKYLYFSEFRDTIVSTYQPIYSNPYAYANHYRKKAEKYYRDKTLRVLKASEFSALAERIHGNLDLAGILLLILESSVASLQFMPGGFSIALEALSDMIIGPKESNALTQDKTTMKALRKKCHAVVEEYRPSIGDTTAGVLINKINDFNKAPNAARLKEPFELLGIELSSEDLRVLDTRNDFLHGRKPDILGSGVHTDDRVTRDVYYAGMRLYVLINMLILKWVGYDNRVINHVKRQERFTKIKLPKEEIFRQV